MLRVFFSPFWPVRKLNYFLANQLLICQDSSRVAEHDKTLVIRALWADWVQQNRNDLHETIETACRVAEHIKAVVVMISFWLNYRSALFRSIVFVVFIKICERRVIVSPIHSIKAVCNSVVPQRCRATYSPWRHHRQVVIVSLSLCHNRQTWDHLGAKRIISTKEFGRITQKHETINLIDQSCRNFPTLKSSND